MDNKICKNKIIFRKSEFMKKILKILIIFLIIGIIILLCRRSYYNRVGVSPKDLYLRKENSQEEFMANKGSYSWSDKGISIIVDSIGPLEMDFSKSIEVKTNDKIYFNDYDWTKVSANIILQQSGKEIANIAIESNLEEKYIVIPKFVSGEYVVKINFESNKGEVWYATKINIIE